MSTREELEAEVTHLRGELARARRQAEQRVAAQVRHASSRLFVEAVDRSYGTSALSEFRRLNNNSSMPPWLRLYEPSEADIVFSGWTYAHVEGRFTIPRTDWPEPTADVLTVPSMRSLPLIPARVMDLELHQQVRPTNMRYLRAALWRGSVTPEPSAVQIRYHLEPRS